MKALKITLITLVIIIGLLLIIGLLSKKDFGTEVSVIIEKPRAEVFDYVKYLKNQDEYSYWSTLDENMETSFTGEDGTVGFISAWSSDKEDVGKGEQEITAIDEGNRIDYELRFIEPFEGTSTAWVTFEDTDEGHTKLTWGFAGNMPYPMNLMLLFVDMEGEIARDYQYGLDKLKGILESMESPIEEEVIEEEMEEEETEEIG